MFEGEGRVNEYVGGYDDWLRQRRPAAPAQTEKTAKRGRPRPRQERPRILTFKEKKELAALPALIESLETERDRLFGMLSDPEFYRQEEHRIAETKARLAELEKEITQSYGRWEMLESILNSQTV